MVFWTPWVGPPQFFVGPGSVRLVALLLLRRNASLAGGFAGRLGLGCVVVCDDLPF